MHKLLIAAVPLALLAACSGDADGGVEPGQWEFTVVAAGFDAPDAPPAAVQAMERQMQSQQPQIVQECFTPAQARNFAQSLNSFSGNDDCEITDTEAGEGELMIRGTCNIPGAASPGQLTMEGTYDRTSLTSDIVMAMDAPPLGAVTVTARMTGQHQGECAG
jgi:hypothetical protein